MTTIHATAIVDPSAELGEGVSVGPFALIERDVRIGDRTVIGPRAVVLRYTTLGADCRIHTGAVLGDLPQDLAFKEQESYVRIGDGCVIREYVTVHRGTKPGTATEIGPRCFLMTTAHVGHNVKLGAQVIVVNGVLLAGYVEVGERAFLSGHSTVHQFVRIGRLAMLGGVAGISKDVPPFCTMRPMTVNAVMGLNLVGMRRAGLTAEERLTVQRAFRILYRSGLNTGQALERIGREFTPGSLAGEMAAFIAASKRGICSLDAGADSGAGEQDEKRQAGTAKAVENERDAKE